MAHNMCYMLDMPELKNPKHEQFCHELLKAPTQTQAYLNTVPNVLPDTAKSNASRLLSNANVKDRFYELLRGSGIDLPHITNRFGRWLNDDNAPVQSWDAVKTGLRIYGVLDAEDKASGIVAVQINIQSLTSDNATT